MKKLSDLAPRKPTRPVQVGNLTIGAENPVVVQSMTNTPTQNVSATVAQIKELQESGCELVRVAVPDREAANCLEEIKAEIEIPLVADVHFQSDLALLAVDAGVDKIRINPGNIGGEEAVRKVVEACIREGVAMRIGVNAGSLSPKIREKYGGPSARALVESALNYVDFCRRLDYHDTVVSLKSSQVSTVVAANRLFSQQSDCPLHLGVTEAGSFPEGAIKTAVGLGGLLVDGIGDTIRVSLTGDPVREIEVAYEILQASGRRRTRPEIITCPTCGRLSYDLEAVVAEVKERLAGSERPIRVAIMGCVVNGPGEAREADVGIAGGDGEGLLFRDGKVLKRIDESRMVEALLQEIEKMDF